MGIRPGGSTESCYPLFRVQFSCNYNIFNANIYGPTVHSAGLAARLTEMLACAQREPNQRIWAAAEDKGSEFEF